VVFAEIDRCATDAIEALAGVSLGKRTLKHVDHGKMAATFCDVRTASAIRVVARDDARERVAAWAPDERDPRRAQIAAYRVMPEPLLLRLEPVVIAPGWLDRVRTRVACTACGEGVTYQREVVRDGRVLCRACAGDVYFAPLIRRAGPAGDPDHSGPSGSRSAWSVSGAIGR
jgi:formylmethanofuran dehydrogenase subunit E